MPLPTPPPWCSTKPNKTTADKMTTGALSAFLVVALSYVTNGKALTSSPGHRDAPRAALVLLGRATTGSTQGTTFWCVLWGVCVCCSFELIPSMEFSWVWKTGKNILCL